MLIGQNSRNRFINGRFDIWQRNAATAVAGTSYNNQLSGTGYYADRWQVRTALDGGTGYTGVVVQGGGQSLVPAGFDDQSFFLRLTMSGQASNLGANSSHSVSQKIENVSTFSGKQITFSMWLSSTVAGKVILPFAQQVFGSGVSNTIIPLAPITLSTTITRYDVSITVPSVGGQLILPATYIELGFFHQIGTTLASKYGSSSAIAWPSTGNIDCYRMMANEGGPADFETAGLHVGQELALCQRYCWADSNMKWSGWTATNPNRGFGPIKFPQTMRAVPTWVWASGGNITDGFAGYTVSSVNTGSMGVDTAHLQAFTGGGTAAARPSVMDSVAGVFDAELV